MKTPEKKERPKKKEDNSKKEKNSKKNKEKKENIENNELSNNLDELPIKSMNNNDDNNLGQPNEIENKKILLI